MLHTLFPKCHSRFLSLPVLGSIADGFDDWLASNGYRHLSRRYSIRMLPNVDADLRRRGIREVADLTHQLLYDCWRSLLKSNPTHAGTVRTLERYLDENNWVADGQPVATSPALMLVEEYANYLSEVRGLACRSVSHHRYTAQRFLDYLDEEGRMPTDIHAPQIESYITKAGKHLSRPSLQNTVSGLRGFLRFLAMDGRAPEGLASQIDTPRLHRLEQLPRALPWTTVRALLRSIDRTSEMGLRDYAIFLLIATYGLRVSEVVAITLDNIRWRQGRLQIRQSKTSSLLELPLTNEVSFAIMKHLKRTPPPPPHRRIFLRVRAPFRALKRTAVGRAFHSMVRKSGLSISCHGPHCLRHSLAVHLLKNGIPLKTIGDILGHSSATSTTAYLRLATEDLREVSLPVPGGLRAKEGQR